MAIGIRTDGRLATLEGTPERRQQEWVLWEPATREGDTLTAQTVELLQTLPTDLVERGWQLVVAESRVVQSADGPRYRAVYSRPFDDRLDREQPQAAVYDYRTRLRIVRVSTLRDHSPSWQDARQDAIRRMREADAKRRRKR